MTTTYTDVFGGDTLPPSDYSYQAFSLTANATFQWPTQATGGNILTDIIEVTANSGPFSITLPDATQSGLGADILFRNVGANSFLVKDAGGNTLATIVAGVAEYVYLTSNATTAGTWGVFTYGTGTSAADASALSGNGHRVNGNKIDNYAPVSVIGAGYAVLSTDNALTLRYGAGAGAINLPTPASLYNGFYVMITNQGSGTATLTPAAGTIDSQSTKTVQPGESLFVVTDGSNYFSVGYGRSNTATFTQLTVDLTGISSVTITSAQAANKLWRFINSPTGNTTVTIPSIASVYYLNVGATGSYTVQFTTGSGSTVTLSANQSYIIYCDGTNVTAAQTVAVTGTIALSDGSAASPTLSFSLDTDTGLYRSGSNEMSVAANGTKVASFGTTGIVYLVQPLGVANGGTGATSLTGVVYGNGTAALTGLNPVGNAGKVVGSDGTSTPVWVTGVASSSASNLAGGAAGKVPYQTGISTTDFTAVGVAGQILTSAGVGAPTWGSKVANLTGGSGGKIPYQSAADTTAFTAAGVAGQVLLSGGTGAPTWGSSGITSVTTATTATTLTSTPTLLQITPTSYGVAVTLPNATTCNKGGPLHIIDNRGAYPVKVLNSVGTLLGFIFDGIVSHISLDDNSTAAGVWAISAVEIVGASAQLLTTKFDAIRSVVALDSDREFILGQDGVDNTSYGVVYRKSTNAFGAVAQIRNVAVGANQVAVLQTTNQVLVVSCTSTAFEAVICSVNASTDAITPGAPATATLSALINTFADGCGLVAVSTGFVCSYTVTTPAAQIRGITVSGTTVSISAAMVLNGTAGGLIAATADKVIAVSTATTHLYTKPYTLSAGPTLTAGTGTDSTVVNAALLLALTPLGTRWATLYRNSGGSEHIGGVISLSGTTTTISVATLLSGAVGYQDAIVVSASKILYLNSDTSNNCNILTDSAGTASAGTAITLSSANGRYCQYVNGTTTVVTDSDAPQTVSIIDCSGASPVLSKQFTYQVSTTVSEPFTQPSNSVLSREPRQIYGTAFAQSISNVNNAIYANRVKGEIVTSVPRSFVANIGSNNYRGKADSERWIVDGATVITKVECVV